MPTEDTTQIESSQVSDAGASPPAPPPPAAAPAAPAGKTISMPSNAIAKIRREEREKGKAAQAAEMERLAKEAGFTSFAEMTDHAKKSKAAPSAAPPGKDSPDAKALQKENSQLRQMVQELETKLQRLSHEKAREERRRRKLGVQLKTTSIESELREAARASGIRDTDYAISLLRRHVKGKTEQELSNFDERKFFEGLKETHGYLFGIEQIPANTTPTGKEPVNSAAPAKPANGAPANEPKDAMKMSPDEYRAALAKRGLRDPSTMV